MSDKSSMRSHTVTASPGRREEALPVRPEGMETDASDGADAGCSAGNTVMSLTTRCRIREASLLDTVPFVGSSSRSLSVSATFSATASVTGAGAHVGAVSWIGNRVTTGGTRRLPAAYSNIHAASNGDAVPFPVTSPNTRSSTVNAPFTTVAGIKPSLSSTETRSRALASPDAADESTSNTTVTSVPPPTAGLEMLPASAMSSVPGADTFCATDQLDGSALAATTSPRDTAVVFSPSSLGVNSVGSYVRTNEAPTRSRPVTSLMSTGIVKEVPAWLCHDPAVTLAAPNAPGSPNWDQVAELFDPPLVMSTVAPTGSSDTRVMISPAARWRTNLAPSGDHDGSQVLPGIPYRTSSDLSTPTVMTSKYAPVWK